MGLGFSIVGLSIAVATGISESPIPPMQKTGIISAGGVIGGCVYTGILAISSLNPYRISESTNQTLEPDSSDMPVINDLYININSTVRSNNVDAYNHHNWHDGNQVCYGELSDHACSFNKTIKAEKVINYDSWDFSSLDTLLDVTVGSVSLVIGALTLSYFSPSLVNHLNDYLDS